MKLAAAILAAAWLVCATGCSQQTVSSANHDVQHDIDTVQAKAKPTLQEADNGTRVTAALLANANLPKTIRVDASPTGVRLKGTVDTAKQKSLAGEIARQTLKAGDTVDNGLVVKGKQVPARA